VRLGIRLSLLLERRETLFGVGGLGGRVVADFNSRNNFYLTRVCILESCAYHGDHESCAYHGDIGLLLQLAL
jgi:hypothetical protein